MEEQENGKDEPMINSSQKGNSKTKKLNKTQVNINVNEDDEDNKLSQTAPNLKIDEDFRSKIKENVYSNKDYMNKRYETMKDIKDLSETMADLSKTLKEDVYKQGGKVNQLEDNIQHFNDNVKEVKKEVTEEDTETRRDCMRTIFVVIGLLLLLVILYLTLRYINK